MKRFPKVLGLGQPLLSEIFDDPVDLSSKIDGSQVRIHLTESNVQCGSKNVDIADDKMFNIAHRQTERIWNENQWKMWGSDITLFTEFLNKPKHNVLSYSRVPKNNLYLFGALIDGKHLKTEELIELATEIDIEPPHIIASQVKIDNPEDLNSYLETESVLGGTKVEGIVIRNSYRSYPPLLVSTMAFDGYPLVGKLVRDDFKERLNVEWSGKKQRETPLNKVASEFFTDARFRKAIQHLNDEEKITYEMNNLKDIIPEFYSDLIDEERQEIMELALDDFWRQLKRKSDNFVVKEWKRYLVDKQFSE